MYPKRCSRTSITTACFFICANLAPAIADDAFVAPTADEPYAKQASVAGGIHAAKYVQTKVFNIDRGEIPISGELRDVEEKFHVKEKFRVLRGKIHDFQ